MAGLDQITVVAGGGSGIGAATALGRSGEPDEIAAAIRFLLSDDSRWITGETLDVSGGAHLKRYPDLVGLVEKAFA